MPYQKFPFFKNSTDSHKADSIEANYEFIPNDKRVPFTARGLAASMFLILAMRWLPF